MRIGEFGALLDRALPKGKKILDKGKPGVGKTFARRQACQRLGMEYIGICAPLQSPVKIGGYPRPPVEEGGDATHCLFDGIARAFKATRPTHLHFDDLGMAGGETLKAIVDLFQFGRIDNRTMPECVVIGASTNDIGHGADVQGIIEPLKTRFHTIIEVETHIDDVVVYGLANGWPGDLLAFLRNNVEALHDWKPSKSVTIDGACPRGWEYVAQWVNDGFDDPEVIAGCVGKGRAAQYLAYRDLANDLPDINQILMDPKGAPVPDNDKAGAQYLVAMNLAAHLTADNFGQVIAYTDRLPAMFQAFTVRDAFQAEVARAKQGTLPKGWKSLASSRDFTAWGVSERGKAIMSATGKAS